MELIPVQHLPEIHTDTPLPQLIHQEITQMGIRLCAGDILVVTSKVVAKWKGWVVREEDVVPSLTAQEISQIIRCSPAYCQLVLNASQEIVRLAPGVLITRTRHGFVMANAGVDASNTAHPGEYVILPDNLDDLAVEIRAELLSLCGVEVAVVISDTFGRPWRNGQIDLAVGCAGLAPLLDLSGVEDSAGRKLKSTLTAIADELAAAADLVAGKTARIPAVLIRGYQYQRGAGSARELVMPEERDLFGSEPSGACALAQMMLRRSVRHFQKRPVPQPFLEMILAAGRSAPSAHHSRPWNFTVVSEENMRNKILEDLARRHGEDMEKAGFSQEKIMERLEHSRQTLGTAAALIILSARERVPANPLSAIADAVGGKQVEEILTIQSVAIAGGQMLLAAFFLGLGGCWYAAPLFCPDTVRACVDIPDGYTPQGMIALGYPAEPKH